MAIDPATAKILAQIDLKASTDEQIRKKIIMITLIPVVSVLVILSMFVYIITHPLDFLGMILSGNELTQVIQLHEQFSLDQNIDVNDASYQQSKGIDYSRIAYSNSSTNIIYSNTQKCGRYTGKIQEASGVGKENGRGFVRRQQFAFLYGICE